MYYVSIKSIDDALTVFHKFNILLTFIIIQFSEPFSRNKELITIALVIDWKFNIGRYHAFVVV